MTTRPAPGQASFLEPARPNPKVETRPAKPRPDRSKYVADFPAGTELNKCGRCNALRLRAIPICPRCRCPEYEIQIIDEAGEVVRQPTEEPARRIASR